MRWQTAARWAPQEGYIFRDVALLYWGHEKSAQSGHLRARNSLGLPDQTGVVGS